jgi:hypothetical protein
VQQKCLKFDDDVLFQRHPARITRGLEMIDDVAVL